MLFTVLEGRFAEPPPGAEGAFLARDNWDDYTFKTMFMLWCSDGSRQVQIGNVKIATFGMEPGRVEVPEYFVNLEVARYFSLGVDETYYERLAALGPEISQTVLTALRDVAVAPPANQQRAFGELAMRVSLMRGIERATIVGQFARIARGGERLANFSFTYTSRPDPEAVGVPPLELGFDVVPGMVPSSNVHVLIGRNGVGKSTVLNGLAHALASGNDDRGTLAFVPGDESTATPTFANLVSVSFSVFDQFGPISYRPQHLTYANVGLYRHGEQAPMGPQELAAEFSRSLRECRTGSEHRHGLFLRALKTLETDPIFQDANVAMLSAPDEGDGPDSPLRLFSRLSSGHKIVLLTITKLVEFVTESSLVLIDEPEAYLHPPLLSAFVRALADLLEDRNGVAVVATHSPVVLQEVPRDCVWTLRRSGNRCVAERPELETFGENVGVLTREVFGLEVTKSGFHHAIEEAVAEGLTYEQVLDKFNGRLGAEGRALTRAAIVERDLQAGA